MTMQNISQMFQDAANHAMERILRDLLTERLTGSPTTYSPPEVAKMFGVSPDTVRGWIKSGRLKATLIGKRRHRISADAVAEFQQTAAPSRRKQKRAKPLVKRYAA